MEELEKDVVLQYIYALVRKIALHVFGKKVSEALFLILAPKVLLKTLHASNGFFSALQPTQDVACARLYFD
jgi:hypothetical protein